MGAEMSEIFVDQKFLPLTSIGQKLVIPPFQSEIFDVPAGCHSDILIVINYSSGENLPE